LAKNRPPEIKESFANYLSLKIFGPRKIINRHHSALRSMDDEGLLLTIASSKI
jgi:hypothetical protein